MIWSSASLDEGGETLGMETMYMYEFDLIIIHLLLNTSCQFQNLVPIQITKKQKTSLRDRLFTLFISKTPLSELI